jgi:hypothetical protein
MGAPLPENDYLSQNNQVFPPHVREARSSTDAGIVGQRVLNTAPSPVPVSTHTVADTMVNASKQSVPQLKSDQAAIDLKTPKLSGIGKLRKARHRAYLSKNPASDQSSLTIADAPLSLAIADKPAPRSRPAEPVRVGLALMASMSALVLLVAALVVRALMPRLSV